MITDNHSDNQERLAEGAASFLVYYENTNPLTTPSDSFSPAAKFQRYRLQSTARELMPNERVAICSRQRIHQRVSINQNTVGNVRFGGLMMCCSVWNCPVCAVRISEQRRAELEHGVGVLKSRDGGTLLLTVTLRHNADDDLSDLLGVLKDTMQRVKRGKSWKNFTRRHGVLGSVYSLEVTWGKVNGWHPHRHELLLLDHVPDGPEISTMMTWLKDRYHKMLAKAGGDATRARGLTLEQDTVAGYIAKFGHDPAWLAGGHRWDEVQEITKAVAKSARTDDRLTPFGMLRVVADGGPDAQEIGERWVDYAKTFKGTRQLVWSRGVKALLGIEDIADADIVNDLDDYEILALLTAAGWSRVLALDCRAELLAVATHGLEALRWFCDANGIEWELPVGYGEVVDHD